MVDCAALWDVLLDCAALWDVLLDCAAVWDVLLVSRQSDVIMGSRFSERQQTEVSSK